jgi:pimeloyl-ACP methyl ester carboxylesterase
MGRQRYPNARELTVTADCGGSNGARVRLWKLELQKLADQTGLAIRVHHYPPGTSKWNKIEHRLSAGDLDVAAGGLHQEIQFCTASDGVRIAYATVGTGPPLVKAANWLNHLEYDWHSPIWSHLLQAVAARYRLIRYDARGNGLSDWDVEDISFEAFVRDLESVVDANGLKRFPLLGISQGCAVSIAYTVRHPERVSQLILYGGYARGRRRRGYQAEVEQADALLTLMRQGWGQENPAFRQIFTSLFMPGATAEQARWFNDLQRMTTSPENAVRIRRTLDEIDVVGLLPEVRVPTLVLHCRNDAVQPFEEGRRMAAGISGSRFVALEGNNHLILEHDPAWTRLLDEMMRFLGS